MARRDSIRLVEAAYRLDLGDEAWLTGVAASAPLPLGVPRRIAAFLYQREAARALRRERTVLLETTRADEAAFAAIHERMSPRALGHFYLSARPCGILSHFAARARRLVPAAATELDWLATVLRRRDVLVIRAESVAGQGCALCVLTGAHGPLALARVDRLRWRQLARHLAAALTLRASSATEFTRALSTHGAPSGRTSCAAAGAEHGRALRKAAMAVDQASRTAQKTDLDPATVWEGLITGRWSRVGLFAEHERTFLLAVENEPGVIDPRRLNPRERTVIRRVLQGASNKFVAYELGLSINTVATHLTRAMDKLGVSTRSELMRWASLGRTRGS